MFKAPPTGNASREHPRTRHPEAPMIHSPRTQLAIMGVLTVITLALIMITNH